MKRIVFVLFLFLQLVSWAQITTVPTLPVASGSVTVTFNSAEDSRLGYYTGDLYAHAGVILDGSSSWQHVIGTWANNTTQPKLTNLGSGIYQLVISPDINTYYSVSSGETVVKLAFVFRSSDGSKQTNDLFITVYQEGLVINLSSPENLSILEQGVVQTFEAESSLDANLSLMIGSDVVQTATGTSIQFQKTFTEPGNFWVYAIAEKDGEVVKDSAYVCVREEIVSQSLPSGARQGVGYPDNQSARLVLWAPGKSYVFVLGSFNNWMPDNTYQMKKDGNYFWLDMTGLTSGEEYPYQYYIDGEIKVADPYTEKILDPDNDPYIDEETYPDLIGYPDGADGIVSVLQPGKAEYVWQYPSVEIPDKGKMIIYELLVRDFTENHTFSAVINKLDYLKDLQINVLELMPVNEFEGNSSWGYNPSFYFAPDKYYGPADSLKRLIDECHKRGIAVVLDMVLNHSYGSSPFVQMYMDNWTITSDNPWYNITSPNTTYSWGYDFNHESTATQALVDSVNSFWMGQYHADGFRFDFTKGFTNTSGDGYAYDASRIAILERMASEIWKRKSGAIVILEHFSDNSEEKVLASYGAMLWGNMNYYYAEAAMGYTSNSNLSTGYYGNRGWTVPNLVTYQESHDEERVAYKCETWGSASGSYDIKTVATTMDRLELNALFYLPIPGPKMIWQFGELGYDYSIDYNDRTGEKPVMWSYTENENRTDLFRVIAKLNYLKQTYDEFVPDNFTYTLSGAVKTYRLTNGSHYAIAVGNFGTASTTTTISFPVTGTWYSYFDSATVQISSSTQSITLAPGEYKLYSTRQFGSPSIKVSNSQIEDVSSKLKVYPNPVNDVLHVEGENLLEVDVFSASGTLQKRVTFDDISNKADIDVSTLPRGMYLLRAKSTENGFSTIKFSKEL